MNTTTVAWYLFKSDGYSHRGARRPTGMITALCGAEYTPAVGPDAPPRVWGLPG